MATETVNVVIGNDIITNANLANMAQGTIKMRAAGAGTGDPIDGTPDQASTVLDAATDPFVRTSNLPAGGGDVVGPASSTDNNVPQWDGVTGELLKDGLGVSLGGNEVADSTKLAQYNTEGQLRASVENSSSAAIWGQTSGNGYAGFFYGPNGSVNLVAGVASVEAQANSGSGRLALTATQLDGTDDIAHFIDAGGDGLEVKNDGGLDWTSATGAATTRTGLGLGTAALNNTGDFDAAGDAAAAQAASQPLDGDLTAIAALSPSNDDIIQRKAGAWTNRTMAQLAADLVPTSVAIRTGSSIAFDVPAVYNDPTTPSSGAVTLDLTGAVAGVEVVAYFNHSAEPSWPAGITAVGTWYNSGLNVVRFLYLDASNISATIQNEHPVSEWRIVRKSSPTTRTSTTTLAADPTLTVPIAANQSVIIRGVVYLTSGATPDFKYRITGPAAASEVRVDTINRAGSGATGPANLFNTDYHSSDQVWAMTGTNSGAVNIYIEVVNGANAGNIAFEWAQNTSDAGNTTVRQNSWLEYQYA